MWTSVATAFLTVNRFANHDNTQQVIIVIVFNCSQTKFVDIMLVLSVFFYAIFHLTDVWSDPFDSSSSKTG